MRESVVVVFLVSSPITSHEALPNVYKLAFFFWVKGALCVGDAGRAAI